MNKILTYIVAWLLSISCGISGKVELSFEEPQSQKKYVDDKAVGVKVKTKGNVDSISLLLNNEVHISLQNNTAEIAQSQLLLGENILVAEAYKAGKSVAKRYLLFEVQTNKTPQIWKPEILRTLKHETDAFTQGLFLHNEKLYETTGERGHSRLIQRNLKDGSIQQSVKLSEQYFGEGATILGNKIYYLTWTAGKGFIFDAKTLQQTTTFAYQKYTKEGWGLTTLGDNLVMSNGSENLLFFNPQTMQLQYSLSVHSNKGRQTMLNELEYDGKYIYANVWLQNYIVVINPRNGRVEATIDCTDLVAAEPAATTGDAVLNGIAYNAATQTFFLTGKNWKHIYEVQMRK